MNPIDRRRVHYTATKVRHRMEEFARQFGYDADLEGLCAIASGVLHDELSKLDVGKPVICFSPFHAFCLLGDTVIDVTATQFCPRSNPLLYPKVMLRQHRKLEHATPADIWHIAETCGSVRQAHEYQKKAGWPGSQRVLLNGLTAI